jgi:hypothetical protein
MESSHFSKVRANYSKYNPLFRFTSHFLKIRVKIQIYEPLRIILITAIKNGAGQGPVQFLIQLPNSSLFIVHFVHLTPFDGYVFVGFIPERIPIFYYPQGDCLILESPEGATAPDGC